MMMRKCMGSLNTKGFTSAVKYNQSQLPSETHLTYDGCFNQLTYSIGARAKKPMELHVGYARAQNQSSLFDAKINDYLAIFTKGNKDGEDRGEQILNAVIVLDISGSMGGTLTSKGDGVRLQLAKQAILMFYSKLRNNDSFGLVTFNTSAYNILPSKLVANRSFEQVSDIVRTIKQGGGTTLMKGFHAAQKQLTNYLQVTEYAKDNSVQNRLIMLTDVTDNSIGEARQFLLKVQNSSIHTTIIGISDSFRSEVCQSLNEIKGFNYFCATQIADLKKYLFENFSFTFFPDVFDIEISIKSDNIQSIQVFGTVDSAKVHKYNMQSVDTFTITKSKTSFPSQLEINQNGEVKTYGGLILVKLKLKQKVTNFEGCISLAYKTGQQQNICEDYQLSYGSPQNQQFYSDQCLYEALSGYFYVFEVKNILKQSENEQQKDRLKYIEPLQQLKKMAPAKKLAQLQDLLTKMRIAVSGNDKNCLSLMRANQTAK